MSPIVIYAPKKSNRLSYVLDYIFNERLKTGYRLVHHASEAGTAPLLSYGGDIPDAGVLWETGVHELQIETGDWRGTPTLFSDAGGALLPFDLFSAVFFLLSRYEEFYPVLPLKHGRYPATDSLLFKHGWLERPLIDEWIILLQHELATKWNVTAGAGAFSFLPTYDIDIAYSYKLKGLWRNAGAAVKDILKGEVGRVGERLAVLQHKRQDPYDAYAFMQQLHGEADDRPKYFVLAALQTTDFDKNISPARGAMQRLIQRLNTQGEVGMHPSYYTDIDAEKFAREKKMLETITGTVITQSRQHYIKLKIPDTYYRLQAQGITDDYSMGYATHMGFRAGTGSSFLWYDLKKEQVTALRIHPFCFMDTTAHFDMGLSVEESFARLREMTRRLQKNGSRLVTVFHNFSLGTEKEWAGWSTAYRTFVKELKEK